MEKVVTMPKLGMTMTEGTVLQWLYQEGDTVEKDEPLVEVMTDKVNMEVEAPFKGRLNKILAQEGDILPVGAQLAILVDDAGVAIEQRSPVTEHMITPPGDPIASTPAAKREAALHAVALHEVVQAGAIPPLHRADVLAFVQNRQTRQVRATPLAQKIAQEHQIDLAVLSTLKAGAKVTRADVEAQIASEGALSNNAHKKPAYEQPASVVEVPTAMSTMERQTNSQPSQDSELIPLSPIRRLIGQRMLSSITTAPHIYLDTEIDMTEAERSRQRIGLRLKEQGEAAPSLTALLLRACAAALIQHPEVNATLEVGATQGKDAIRRWHVVHIGVAVDTGQTLLTPVIRNAHRQTLSELARELRRLTQAAREGSLSPEEMANATFTISNLGMYGIDTFHAIIPPGQSAILAVGKTTKRGVVIEDKQGEHLEIRPIMKVSLSADHRVLDGAGGSRFLQRLKTFLEEPYLLL
jgi:pyruvate dehydrogenase complex dihydrolipoamide acetyltransferase long form